MFLILKLAYQYFFSLSRSRSRSHSLLYMCVCMYEAKEQFCRVDYFFLTLFGLNRECTWMNSLRQKMSLLTEPSSQILEVLYWIWTHDTPASSS